MIQVRRPPKTGSAQVSAIPRLRRVAPPPVRRQGGSPRFRCGVPTPPESSAPARRSRGGGAPRSSPDRPRPPVAHRPTSTRPTAAPRAAGDRSGGHPRGPGTTQDVRGAGAGHCPQETTPSLRALETGWSPADSNRKGRGGAGGGGCTQVSGIAVCRRVALWSGSGGTRGLSPPSTPRAGREPGATQDARGVRQARAGTPHGTGGGPIPEGYLRSYGWHGEPLYLRPRA